MRGEDGRLRPSPRWVSRAVGRGASPAFPGRPGVTGRGSLPRRAGTAGGPAGSPSSPCWRQPPTWDISRRKEFLDPGRDSGRFSRRFHFFPRIPTPTFSGSGKPRGPEKLYRIGIGDYRLVDTVESSGLIVIVVERREAEPPPGRTRRGDAGAVRPRRGPGTSRGGTDSGKARAPFPFSPLLPGSHEGDPALPGVGSAHRRAQGVVADVSD